MKVTLDKNAIMPDKAHLSDAGYDLFLQKQEYNESVTIKAGETLIIDTGVHIQLPEGYAAVCMSKSGLSFNYGVETVMGLIDSGYTGSIQVKLRNTSNKDHTFYGGDKISQLVVFPICTEWLELAYSLEKTKRGNGGFGSTGV